MKRVTLFAGHYGSGKTNLAINYALHLSEGGGNVCIADLDVVNPYFRTKDSTERLKKAGVNIISSAYANTNLDIPALPAELYSLVQQRDKLAVFDIGGDDDGAFALGRYTPYILEENDYEMVFVVNFYRPLTRTAQQALEYMRDIEAASGIAFTAIANNSNVGEETTPEDVAASFGEAEKLSRISSLPLLFTAAEKSVAEKMEEYNIFSLTLQEKYFDIKEI